MRVSENNFTKPLSLSLEFSHAIFLGIVVLHMLVASIIVATSSVVIAILALLLVISSFVYYYRWHVTQSLAKSIIRVKLSSIGDWSLINSQNKRIKATLLPTSFLSQYLLILNFHSLEMKKYTVLIPKGRVSSDDFRQLKVRLKTKGWNKDRGCY